MAEQTLPECGQHQGTCVRCGLEIKSKPRQNFKGEEKRKRKTLSIRVPDDEQEDGAGIWDDLIEQAREKLGTLLDNEPGRDPRPVYYILTDVLYDWLT